MTGGGAGTRQRLNRFLASRGVASRRGADTLIAAGRVGVNESAGIPGTIVDPAVDRITVDGRPVPDPLPRRTLMLNKPPGVLTTRHDPQGRPTVLELVDDPSGLFPVGRLDADSGGLLLLTTDGELAFRLAHPRHGVTKQYRVTVAGHVPTGALARIAAGVELDDGPARALAARVARRSGGRETVEVTMAEGRKREVRRLFAAVGLEVVDLVRVAFGPLRLGRLAAGGVRRLTREEEAAVYASVGLPGPS